ncbi:hypothetical protein Y032_0379g329 [Ancylostoma ceylanicum]|uniref:G-protein coupled receptors family 1 profile domain-containing protein n=1 Tax=Ancylostoma ceylanicum TaxID=53326 RepID=A0A016RU30_9BILA|nr:hypothetical protein Y032_0379g329 [Ancylostoma ceylanicum]
MEFHFVFLPCIIFIATILGLFGNFSLIYAVVRYKNIRTKHGILLAFLCLYESFGLIYESISGIRMITNTSMMPRSKCFRTISPYIFTITVQAMMMIALAVDVLISLTAPITHKLMKPSAYLILMHIPCVAVSLYFIVGGMVHMNDEIIIACNPPLALPAMESEIWNYTTMATNAVVVFVYALVVLWLFREYKSSSLHGTKSQPKHYKRVLRSAATVNAISVICWFMGAGISRFPFNVDAHTQELIHTYAVIPPLIIMSQNYYVYFLLSTDYRFVFRQMLGLEARKVMTFSRSH